MPLLPVNKNPPMLRLPTSCSNRLVAYYVTGAKPFGQIRIGQVFHNHICNLFPSILLCRLWYLFGYLHSLIPFPHLRWSLALLYITMLGISYGQDHIFYWVVYFHVIVYSGYLVFDCHTWHGHLCCKFLLKLKMQEIYVSWYAQSSFPFFWLILWLNLIYIGRKKWMYRRHF